MKWIVRLVVVLLLLALSFWVWKYFFPTPEIAIRRQLMDVARLASFSPRDSAIAKTLAVKNLMDSCTDDIEISVDIQGWQRATFTGKQDLQQSALVVRHQLSSLSVEFLDINVSLAPNKQTAIVNLTAKIRVPGEKDFFPQELKFTMKKVDGKWLIRKIETVRTLSRATHKFTDLWITG